MTRKTKKLRRRLQRVKQHVKAWCRWVSHRVARERGYIEAVVVVGVELADLFCRSEALRRLSRKAALTVLVVLRAQLHSDDIYPDPITS